MPTAISMSTTSSGPPPANPRRHRDDGAGAARSSEHVHASSPRAQSIRGLASHRFSPREGGQNNLASGVALRSLAEAFADSVTQTIQGVVPTTEAFTALITDAGASDSARVASASSMSRRWTSSIESCRSTAREPRLQLYISSMHLGQRPNFPCRRQVVLPREARQERTRRCSDTSTYGVPVARSPSHISNFMLTGTRSST